MLSPMCFDRTLRLAVVCRPSISLLFTKTVVFHTLLRERPHRAPGRAGRGGRGGYYVRFSLIVYSNSIGNGSSMYQCEVGGIYTP